ncbi:MFS transporter [Ktedonobacter sp. SOSP1-85]|uniref:MFS transporter n=1 Tax=Ktedonobacter sp. SOSP1-85 TaxID=2778367 RepID=UPI001914DFCC|nr:MFS transporter [Ktedonobacter sp. SOSP1-85]GHO75604.1 MFS transporter [Ktedonobacter sp. SOSP1-85]
MVQSTDQAQNAQVSNKNSSGRVRRVLRNRNFLLLWLAQLISLTILNATNYGVIVLVNNVTQSVFMAGLAIISFTLPAIPFSAIAGAIVDRLNKRQVLWVSNILRMVTVLLMFICIVFNRGNLWPLFLLTYCTSLIGQFFIPAEGSSIPLLVGERDLMPALSLFNISITISQALGFLILGRLVTSLFSPFTVHIGKLAFNVQSIDMLFLLVGVLYAVCAGLILLIPSRCFAESHLKQERAQRGDRTVKETLARLWADLGQGWRIVQVDNLLFFSVVQLSVVGILQLLIGELAGTFVQQVLHHPPEDMALILAPAGVGLVGASVLMTPLTERIGRIRLTLIGFISLAVGFLLLPAMQWLSLRLDPVHGASSSWLLWSVILLVTLLGVAMACVNIPTNTIMQERAPENGRARVLAFQFMLYNAGSIPVLLFAGAIAQLLGFNLLIVVLAACMFFFCFWASRFGKRQPGRRSQQDAHAAQKPTESKERQQEPLRSIEDMFPPIPQEPHTYADSTPNEQQRPS